MPKFKSFREFSTRIVGRVWNPNTKELFGKPVLTWAQLVGYYLSFYAVFAIFYATCIGVFVRTLGEVAPTMTSMMSLLKNNPGLNFEPRISNYTTLIKAGKSFDNRIAVERLANVYSTYTNLSDDRIDICNEMAPLISRRLPCRFNTSWLGELCSPQHHFGYSNSKPCVMLRINKVYGWDPDANDLATTTCTQRLTSPGCGKLFEFQDIPPSRKTLLKSGFIPISCQGQNPGDEDNILKVNFFPEHGLPSYHYPYFNQPGFHSPPIMAQFHLVPGVLVMVWCRLWTNAIKHNLADHQGGARFEIMVETNATFSPSVWSIALNNIATDG